MDETGCPRCKTTKYRNPSLKLLVNICGHALCENCVDNLFVRGSGACPECGVALRRNNFRLQFFEDAYVEKEVDVRKKILKDFNKKEEDFDSLNEYNDYLEEVENIILSLVSGVNAEETKRKIEQYKKLNKDAITKNKMKKSKDEEYLEACLEEEKLIVEERTKESLDTEFKEKTEKMHQKQSLIDDLMFSDKSATDIVATHQKQAKLQEQHTAVVADSHKPKQPQAFSHFSTGIKIGQQGTIPYNKLQENLYSYKEPVVDTCGPCAPSLTDIMSTGYLNHVRAANKSELGGGYQAYMACQRALQEAVNGLFYTFDVASNLTGHGAAERARSTAAQLSVSSSNSSHSSNDAMDAE